MLTGRRPLAGRTGGTGAGGRKFPFPSPPTPWDLRPLPGSLKSQAWTPPHWLCSKLSSTNRPCCWCVRGAWEGGAWSGPAWLHPRLSSGQRDDPTGHGPPAAAPESCPKALPPGGEPGLPRASPHLAEPGPHTILGRHGVPESKLVCPRKLTSHPAFCRSPKPPRHGQSSRALDPRPSPCSCAPLRGP